MAKNQLLQGSIQGSRERMDAEAKSGEGLKRPVNMRRNLFGPSDPFIARPESSAINATGQIQSLERRSIHDISAQDGSEHNLSNDSAPATQNIPKEEDEIEVEDHGLISPLVLAPIEHTAAHTDIVEQSTENTVSPPVQASSHTALSPSNILGHSPSEPGSALAIGTQPEIIDRVHALNAPQSVGNALSEIPNVSSPASLPVKLGGKMGRKKRLIRRVRKGVLRRRLLAALLGRELGDVTYTVLQQGQAVSGAPVHLATVTS